MASALTSIKMKKAMQLNSGKEALCEQHQEKLLLFCKEDEKLLCVRCEHSSEHKGHTTLLLEEAAKQQKEKISDCLKTLRTEMDKIQGYIADAISESQEMLKNMELEKQQTVKDFKALHQLLNNLEKHLLEKIEERKNEIARKRNEHQAKCSKEISSLKNRIQEGEKKSQQSVSELLQDPRGTLQRYEKESFKNPEAFPYELKKRDLYTPFLASTMQQFQDTLEGLFPKQRVNVTLDPASASSRLSLDRKRKNMRWKSAPEDQNSSLVNKLKKSFESLYPGFVLGNEGFTAGKHFWEIIVESGGDWAVGVAKKPVKNPGNLTPEEGIWAMGSWMEQAKAFIKDKEPPFTMKFRVCLNYDKGRVAFFDAERAALLYEFSGTSFSGETIYPFFAVYYKGLLWVEP